MGQLQSGPPADPLPGRDPFQYGLLCGPEGPRAELYRDFARDLAEVLGKEVRLWDERRTTVEAHQILSDHNYHGKKRKNTVDAVAASLILEGYLAFRNR